jgi:Zn-dependent protease with chaperone function
VNFFEHQDRARRQSRRLLFIFALAVVAIVVAIDAVIMLAVGVTSWDAESPPMSAWEMIRANGHLLAGGAVATLAVITVASLGKTISLRTGGAQVARALGGSAVESDTRDPLRRRLRHVVEEIAIASGVPVPDIFVLDRESGINAFAAGYAPTDAAVAVTRGALEKLDRNELQGVIAHEFSHILNGDMRLNIRLMGALFGILVLALIGRRVLMHAHLAGRSSRDRGGAVVLLIAFGLMAIGYIGLFFGRWIKAAVSRQREYLADASAVQFTRDPDGIGGALKKIAVYSDGSYLDADAEEISHMLFGDGRRMLLFSTHPPIRDRISRVDPGFRPEELDRLAARIMSGRDRARPEPESRTPSAAGAGHPVFDAGGLIDRIGSSDWQQMLFAAAMAASVSADVRRAARSAEWAPAVLLYCLLDGDESVREDQLLLIAGRMGTDSETRVRGLLDAGGPAAPEHRLPLLEIAFPALKSRPPDFVRQLLETVRELTAADGKVDVFEYLLAKLITQYLWESFNPHRVRETGREKLESCRDAALAVMAVLARHGHDDPASAQAAFAAGLEQMPGESRGPFPETADWVATLDAALPRLDRLKPSAKETFVRALATVALHDRRVRPAELELLRAVCGLIHVPLPLLRGGG